MYCKVIIHSTELSVMLYYSTNQQSPEVSFKEAAIRGQAPDKGLYFPAHIPALSRDFLARINNLSKEEIAYTVISPYVGDAIPPKELQRIVRETVDFSFPLVPVKDSVYALELYHGPTLAFKDVGARFMSRCLGYFMKSGAINAGNNAAAAKKITVLVATSGDTGGAVANGFHEVEGVEVIILYPSGKVSGIQELQLTTLGGNITALEVNGSFDDCQDLVKQAFADTYPKEQLFLTSANSINIARWLPQQFYYFFAWQQWEDKDNPPVICVPSGNFGNICAGLLAHHAGLPARHFIAACNANNSVPSYLDNGRYVAKKSVSTISNAMDVGNPSNFIRVLEIFNREFSAFKNTVSSYSISDEQTKATLLDLYNRHHYLADPHGAVGFNALDQYLAQHPGEKGIVLETAHPVKFYDVVEPLIGEKIPIPDTLAKGLLTGKKKSIPIEADYGALKNILLR